MVGYICIFAILAAVYISFKRKYIKGVYVSLFFLILMPKNATIELGMALPSFTIHRMIMLVWFFMWCSNKSIDKEIRKIAFVKILITISILMGLSTLFSSEILISIKRYLYFLVETLLFFIMLQTSLKDAYHAKRILHVIAVSLLCVAVVGIVERFTGFNPSPLFGEKTKTMYELTEFSSIYDNDVQSTYQHRILFGIAMSISLFCYMFFMSIQRNMSSKIKYWIVFFIGASALYFSLSRGPWLACMLGLVFLFACNPRFAVSKFFIIIAIAAVITMSRPGILDTIHGLVESTLDMTTLKGSSFQWRFQVWEVASKQIVNAGPINTLIGFGPGSQMFNDFGCVEISSGHVVEMYSWDNEFAIILYEQGFLGLLLWLCLYLNIFATSMYKNILKKHYFSIAVFSLPVIFIFVFMKTNVSIFIPQLVYIEFSFIAIISALQSSRFKA